MMDLILPRSPRPAPLRLDSRPATTWAAWVLIFYVIYLGLILPFVCWGAMGQPGHPHPVAHFVFAVPEIPHADHPQIPSLTVFADDVAHSEQPAPVGQSRPDTTLISLLLLVFVGAWLLFGHHPRRFAHRGIDPSGRSLALPIPTPPPRILDCQFWIINSHLDQNGTLIFADARRST